MEFQRSNSLNNIPAKKLNEALANVTDDKDKAIKLTAINRYAESNIPVEYWNIKMDKDFTGDSRLLEKYNSYISDIKASYINGKSICFAGHHGLGKTFICTSILKVACHKGYSCLYSDISNIITVLTQAHIDDKFIAKRELTMVDFLVVDELDPRFFNASESAMELFAKSFENILRTRRQNKLPTLVCTNSPNIIESFSGPLKESLSSLFSDKMEMFPIFGNDFRKMKG